MYRPYFALDRTAPSAAVIMRLWMQEHRFLPLATSEPDLLASLVFDVLRSQANLQGVPTCILHEKRMALLGRLGRCRQTTHRVLTMAAQLSSTKNGFEVAAGIFRCPVPGCVRVAPFKAEEEFEPRRPRRGTFTPAWQS